MPKCPNCSAVILESEDTCDACGLSISAESDQKGGDRPQDDSEDHTPTRINEFPDEENTPTQLKESGSRDRNHITTDESGRFVAGTILANRYRILGLLGKGGMGEVYKAEDLELKQTVALKFLPEKLAKNRELLERFRGEVRNARRVSHQNVCRVFDIGEIEGVYYISMEHIDGDDLSMLLQRIGRFPSDKAVEISRQICMGLNAVHKAGILHRDLKPANIIIDSNGEARITDFGIAGLEADVRDTDARVGTPAYMSPEQVSGKQITKASDIYSLGLLLYEVFTGKQAFEADSVPELLDKQTTGTPTTPSEIVTGIDPIVEDLISQCLEKDPEHRPESAMQVALKLPGGNPLQVALEAGETPSPEMVAATPTKGALKPVVAVGLLVGFVGLFSLVMYWSSVYKPNALTPLEKSPEVLAERARILVNNLGYRDLPADSHSMFVSDSRYLSFAQQQENPSELWGRIRKGQPYYYYYQYRQSNSVLIPQGMLQSVSLNNPPMTRPGMISVKLDTTGRLIEFKAVPPERVQSKSGGGGVDWRNIFKEAGLDIATFREVKPTWNPLFMSDENRQWEGVLPDFPDMPLRINGSGLYGQPIEFKVTSYWEELAPETQLQAEREGTPSGLLFFGILFIVVTLGAVLLVRYNFQSGRGDLRGAVKLAFVTFSFAFVSNALIIEWQTDLIFIANHLFGTVAISVVPALVVLAIYLAVEPFVRKRWSEVLVSWSRLFTGHFRDPMIGRDILVGSFLSIAFEVFQFVVFYLNNSNRPNSIFEPFNPGATESLNGFSYSLGNLLIGLPAALINAFTGLFVLLVFSLVFRRKRLAILATVLLFSAGSTLLALTTEELSTWSPLLLTLGAIVLSVITIGCLVRFGFLATTAFWVVHLIVSWAMVTFDPSSFYFSETILRFAVAFGIAIIACYISIAGQPFFSKSFLEGSEGH